MIIEAPAKLNLCLYVGARREDGLHEIRSIFQPLNLVDTLEVTEGAAADEVICPGVEGPELAARALAALRDAGWNGPPLRIEVEKRIPVAAGLGGGSADAAAVLRLAAADVDPPTLLAVAGRLGADVPSQLDPRTTLVAGAGEVLRALPSPPEYGVVLIPLQPGLGAGEVYSEFDRLEMARTPGELAEIETRLLDAAAGGDPPHLYAELLVNDLQAAAVSLRPEIGEAIAALDRAGALRALMSGSGPTVFGVFKDPADAVLAASAMRPAYEGAIAAPPLRAQA